MYVIINLMFSFDLIISVHQDIYFFYIFIYTLLQKVLTGLQFMIGRNNVKCVS